MRHVSDAVLRRLLDEPFAVPDAARLHVETCGRCRACRGQISGDAAFARRVLSPPQLAFDSGLAWTQVEHRLARPAGSGHPAFRVPRRPARRLVNASIGTGTAAAAGLVLAGVAAAATLTTVFAPTKVAPVQVNPGDLRAIATALGIGPVHPHGGLSPAAGSEQLPFGTLRWTSAGQAQRVASLHQARALTSLTYSPPATLPAGVGSPSAIIVQPKETATISFSPAAGAYSMSRMPSTVLSLSGATFIGPGLGAAPAAGCGKAVDSAVWKVTLPSTFCTTWWIWPLSTVTEPNGFSEANACSASPVVQPHCG